jgi:hypothetical protein
VPRGACSRRDIASLDKSIIPAILAYHCRILRSFPNRNQASNIRSARDELSIPFDPVFRINFKAREREREKRAQSVSNGEGVVANRGRHRAFYARRYLKTVVAAVAAAAAAAAGVVIVIIVVASSRRAASSRAALAAIVPAARPRSRARHFPAIIEATEPLGAEIPHRLQFVGWH